MSYASIDSLQIMLKEQVFSHAQDAKKAAGRALGTLVEIIAYYLLREWGLADCISIERGLPEYGYTEITHKVEFMLHPVIKRDFLCGEPVPPLTFAKLHRLLGKSFFDGFSLKEQNTLLDKNCILKNSCLLAEDENSIIIANILDGKNDNQMIEISNLYKSPYAMVECKRVGVEEGCKKGPQTIEKAKQGAYVAQTTSSLQKIRTEDGQLNGLIYSDGKPVIMQYDKLLMEIINGNDMLKNFIMSIGVVSNHGNWFTADNKNKELKVLARSYDWLIFLTDDGLAQIVTDLLLAPSACYEPVRYAFTESYKQGKKMNVFTKSKIALDAHKALGLYFSENIDAIENWFNVIAPDNRSISDLRNTLFLLYNKDWRVFQ